jgi:hypothetical protein
VVSYFLLVPLAFAQKAPEVEREGLKLVQAIETPSNAPDHFWVQVHSMATDESGTLLAMFDEKLARVSVLDIATSKLIAAWGTKGSGPGELTTYSAWIGIRKDTVFIGQQFRLSAFSLKGQYLKCDTRLNGRLADHMMVFGGRQSFGMDRSNHVYYFGGNRIEDFVILKGARTGEARPILRRKDIMPDIAPRTGSAGFGVLPDGSFVLSFGHRPLIVKYDSASNMVWSCNLANELPSRLAAWVNACYEWFVTKRLPYSWTNFWADSEYTILTLAGGPDDDRIGEPAIRYFFIDTKTGKYLGCYYAQENIVKRLKKDENDIPPHSEYAPWAIAHSRGYVFAFCYNNSRLVKYKLLWTQRQ